MTMNKLEIPVHKIPCNFEITRMKKSYGGIVIASLFMLLLLRYAITNYPIGDSYPTNVLFANSTNPTGINPLEWFLKRFFVGLHKNQIVNEELWNEAQTYGDIQLMPFVDYYGLITWKTLAICIFGTEVVSAKFVMKTDDDAFVRVDEVLASLNRINVTSGLLYGLINSDSQPHRNPESKWYISIAEYQEENYPSWAHGPGYVVSSDIAKAFSRRYKKGNLKMFKLEDVAMGIWTADMKKEGLNVRYEKEDKVYNEGCTDGYIVAHYQGPREMLCLWQKIQEGQVAKCCGGEI